MTHSDELQSEKAVTFALAKAAERTEAVETGYSVDQQEDGMSIRRVLHVIRRHALLIAVTVLAAIGIRAYQLSKVVPTYIARSTVRFNDTRSNLTAGVGSNDQMRMSQRFVDVLKSQMELLSSLAVAEEAVDRGKLQLRELSRTGALTTISELDAGKVEKPDTLTLTFEPTATLAKYGALSAAAPYGSSLTVGPITLKADSPPEGTTTARFEVIPKEAAVGMVRSARANIREDTDIADISFTSTDPVLAQRAVNAVSTALQTVNIRSSQQGARARREFIEDQLRKSDSVLANQRAQLSAFRSSTQAFSSRDKIASEQQSLSAIEMRRGELEADRQVFQSLLAHAMTAKPGETNGLKALVSAPGIAANPVITQVYTQFVELVRTRDSLTTGPFPAAPTSPDVIRLNALIQSSRDELINAVSSQIESLDARIAALRTMGEKSAAQVSSLPRSEAEESRLIQEAQGTQRMVEQLQQEEQRARISEVAQGGQVEIIDLARTPGYPMSESRSRKLMVAAMIGLLLGIGLAFLREEMNVSLRRFDDVEEIFQVPTLAVIPSLDGQGRTAVRQLRLPGKRNGSSNGKHNSELVKPAMPAFEAFRALRTSLISSDAVQSLKTIVVTSPAPGDGKSTTTANLAAAFAQQGMRVLAVDCDFRRGRLHKFFGFQRSPGLTNIVLGESTLESTVHATSIPNLFALASGANPPNSTELLGSDAVRRILIQAIADYDLVILDSPPLLATADAAILSSMADGVIVIARMGVTDRDAAKRARRRLRLVGARVLGTVINDPDNVLGSSEEYYYAYAPADGDRD